MSWGLQRMRGRTRETVVAGLVLGLLAGGGARAAMPGTAAGEILRPHRAIYELRLAESASGSGVTALRGRLVFSLQGSACAGYEQAMRLVTQMTDREGNNLVSDLRTSSSEDAGGQTYRFQSDTFRDDSLAETTAGEAHREGEEAIVVELSEPAARRERFEGRILFPIQHSLAMLAAARRGDELLDVRLYDGSDNGAKVYQATTVIGHDSGARDRSPAPGSGDGDDDRSRIAGLEKLPSWPMLVSYFEPLSLPGEVVPAYEMGFRMFENGVVRDLRIDYGDFALDGELSKLEYLELTACE